MPPMTQKLVAAIGGFLLVVGALGYFIYAKMGENSELQTAIDNLNQEIAGFEEIIKTKEAKEKQRNAQDDVFKELVTILPRYSQDAEGRVLNALTSFAAVAKLDNRGFAPKIVKEGTTATSAQPVGQPKPPTQAQSSDFAQTELRLRYEGTFFNLLQFLNMVENHTSFLRIDEVNCTPLPLPDGPQPDQRKLNIVVKVSTFHYVSK